MSSYYEDSGVDTKAGDDAVMRIKQMAQSTHHFTPGKILSGIGGFGAVIENPDGSISGYTTDGVGTKLLLAILLDKHDTVGIDLVAMSVNDLAVLGITPHVFLDYIAMGKQIPERTEEIVRGIANGCRLAQVALMGGEMAEMPGMYREEDYDLAGFAVGHANSREDLIFGDKIMAGMNVYGVRSSGIHANGLSLIRKVFEIDLNKPVTTKVRLEKYYRELDCTLGEELLIPTEIYVSEINRLRKCYSIAGMVHITGGGFVDNPPRVLPEHLSIKIDVDKLIPQPIFQLIHEVGNVPIDEMLRVFNCGVGLLVISPDEISNDVTYKIGEVVRSKDYFVENSETVLIEQEKLF